MTILESMDDVRFNSDRKIIKKIRFILWILNVALIISSFGKEVKAENIVLLGDSHMCGDFGRRMFTNLVKKGNTVTVFCTGGRTAQHFLTGKAMGGCKWYDNKNSKARPCSDHKMDDMIRKVSPKPDHVIPAFGSNDLGRAWKGSFKKLAQKIVATGAKCTWIGPPPFDWEKGVCKAKYQQYHNDPPEIINEIKTDTASLCRFIDSAEHTKASDSSDCIHRYGKKAFDWADGISGHFGSSKPMRSQASQNR